ncbi:MAG: hypothetical protein H7842_07115 [Gammaproteobacteria bacterium SHHR-1]
MKSHPPLKSARRTGLIALCLFTLTALLPGLAAASYLAESDNPALFKLQAQLHEINQDYTDGPYRQASLINLNQAVNRWYLLALTDRQGRQSVYNLITLDDRLVLDLDNRAAEVLITGERDEQDYDCPIDSGIVQARQQADKRSTGYLPVCNGQLLLTIKQNGFQPAIEKGAELIRWFAGDVGEGFINTVKEHFFQDRYTIADDTEQTTPSRQQQEQSGPERARIRAGQEGHSLSTRELQLVLAEDSPSLLAGQWYPLKHFDGVYASLMLPGLVPQEIEKSHRDRVKPLDGVERNALVYSLAVDLDQYSLGWGHGTDHPGVGWSERAIRIKKDNPHGPDGFDRLDPLIPMGQVPPYEWARTIGTFSAGFQLRHSAFRYGKMSTFNKAHHYGFMEKGVLLSSPTENLVTLIMYQDGTVDMKVWEKGDEEKLPRIRHLRQNGVPLIHPDETGQGIPGVWVKHWGAGNWSGSADKKLRTPRGAACLLEQGDKRYLVYSYFSGATPSAMARTFQAYDCKVAIHLDLNSPGQAYASLFRPTEGGKAIDMELLVRNMNQYMGDYGKNPRYLLKPDYKDFFYIFKKD